jgi:hypothetical protein
MQRHAQLLADRSAQPDGLFILFLTAGQWPPVKGELVAQEIDYLSLRREENGHTVGFVLFVSALLGGPLGETLARNKCYLKALPQPPEAWAAELEGFDPEQCQLSAGWQEQPCPRL